MLFRSCKIYNLDFPDVIAVRNELLPAGEREQNIPCDLKDPAWFDKIDASGRAVFFASGVFYYFLTEQVKALVQRMAVKEQNMDAVILDHNIDTSFISQLEQRNEHYKFINSSSL